MLESSRPPGSGRCARGSPPLLGSPAPASGGGRRTGFGRATAPVLSAPLCGSPPAGDGGRARGRPGPQKGGGSNALSGGGPGARAGGAPGGGGARGRGQE